MILSIPVISIQSGYAKIQTTGDLRLGNINNQKLQDKHTNKESLNLTPHPENSSQDKISDSELEDNSNQNEIDNRSKDMQSNAILEITGNPEGNSANFTELADYTVLVYMIGSDLELRQYAATEDIREMLTVGSNKNVNIVIETGGSNSSVVDDKRFIDFTTVQRHKIFKNHYQTLDDLGKENMAVPATLSSFLKWGVLGFPAKKYVVILWDHGTGINGFGKDTNFGGDIFTNLELTEAFADTKDSIHTNFEIIGFDACLMASIEVANNIKSFGNYMVASQELVPPAGWHYSAFLKSLVMNPSQDGKTLGKNIADSYQKYYIDNAQKLGYEVHRMNTMSVVDLQQVPDLVNTLEDLAAYLNNSISDANSSKSFARVIDSTDGNGKSLGQLNLIDIYDLASKVMKRFPESSTIVNKVHMMLINTVVNTTNGQSKPDANGLSIYLPSYSRLSESLANALGDWSQVITKQHSLLNSDTSELKVDSQVNGKTITGWVNVNDLSNITLKVARMDSNNTTLFSEELDPSKLLNSKGYFRYLWDGEILSFCSLNSCLPATMSFESNGNIKLAVFPALVESNNNYYPVSLLYEVNEQEKANNFLGAIPEMGLQKTVSKERYGLQPGAYVYPSVDSIPNTSYDSYHEFYSDKANLQKLERKIDERDESFLNQMSDSNDGLLKLSEEDMRKLKSEYDQTVLKYLGTGMLGIKIKDQFGPRYITYKGSFSVTLDFCDYSNNCNSSLPLTLSNDDDTPPENRFKDLSYNFSRYTSISGISISYPSNWIVEDNDRKIGFHPVVEEDLDTLSEGLTIYERPSLNRSLNNIVDRVIANGTSKVDGFELLQVSNTTIARQPAISLLYTYASVGSTRTGILDTFTLTGKTIYRFVFQFDPTKFQGYLPIVQKMIDSFEVTENNDQIQQINGSKIRDFLIHEDNEVGISIHYPSDWNKVEMTPDINQSKIVRFYSFFNRAQPFEIDLYVANTTSLNQLNTKLIDRFEGNPYFNLLESEPTVVSGKPAHKIVYEINNGQNQSIGVKIWTIDKHNLFMITFSSNDTTKFHGYLPIVQKMIDSFEILDINPLPTSMESYESENYNIYIDYPSTWKALSNNSTLRFVSPYDDDNDTFRENLLISKNLNRNQSLTERIENLGQSIQDFRFIDHHNVTIDDNLSHGVTYSFTQNEKELKAMQIWTDRQDADYTITYFADVSKYKKFLPIIEKMINSLDISEFVTYNDNSVGLKIKYPAEWREVKIGMNKEISPKTILQYKSDLESLIVVYDSNPFVRNLTPRELGIQEINLLSQYHSDFNLLESEPTVVSGKPAHKIVYEINEGQNKFVETDIIAKSETGIFVISYVCLAEEYPERISTIRKISYSIKLNEFNDTSNNKTELKRPIFLTYENPSSGISIQYPKQWNIHEHFGVIMGYPVVSFTSEFESSLDRYKENITLYIEDKACTEEYIRSHDSQLNITRNSNSLAGNEAQAFEYITKENGIDIRIVQIWTMVDEKIYRIRYVTEPVKYHDYKSILDKMISSFQINAPDSARWDYLTYENPALGLNIQYPVDWKLHFYNPNEILQKPVLVAKFGPYSENTSLAVIPTVDISISKLNINHITTEYLADLYIQHYMKLYPNFELLEVDNSTLLSGLPAYKFMSTATYPLDSTSQMINVVAIINKTVYNLRYYSEPEVFYTHLPKFDHMMQSFKIYN